MDGLPKDFVRLQQNVAKYALQLVKKHERLAQELAEVEQKLDQIKPAADALFGGPKSAP